MRALITGINGFVGQYLKRELLENGYDVVGIDIHAAEEQEYMVDLLDLERVTDILQELKADCIFHLAGQASVAKSWVIPQKTIELNTIGTINLLEAVRTLQLDTKILLIGSSDQYGKIAENQCLIGEETKQNPKTPYAISKCAQEQLGVLYIETYGLKIYMTRSFNHIGVGQMRGYVVPDLAYGIAEIEAGLKNRLKVGNLKSYRDFTDIRDIVRAYRFIIEKGVCGTIYNVGSGRKYQIREILDLLIGMTNTKITVEEDIQKLRVSDVRSVQCDHSLLSNDTGWNPNISIQKTLKEILEFYRKQLLK